MSSPKNIQSALQKFALFAKAIRAKHDPGKRPQWSGGRMIARDGLGMIFLDPSECVQYSEILSLLCPDERSPGIRSRSETGKVLDDELLSAVFVKQDEEAAQGLEAIRESSKRLRAALETQPKPWTFYRSLSRIVIHSSGFAWGNLFIYPSKHEELSTFKERYENGMADFLRCFGLPAQTPSWEELCKYSCFYKVTVLAVDHTAAEALAVREADRGFDVLNFFALLSTRCQLAPQFERNRCFGNWTGFEVVVNPVGKAHLKQIGDCAIYSFDPERNRKATNVFSIIQRLLKESASNKLADRLIAAMEWAGKSARTNDHRDAFLFAAIALEGLLLGGKNESQLQFRLSLYVAHLLGTDLQSKQFFKKQVRDLYQIRSKIAHAGRMTVTLDELDRLRIIVQSCIVRILNLKMFPDWNSEGQFDEFLESLALGERI